MKKTLIVILAVMFLLGAFVIVKIGVESNISKEKGEIMTKQEIQTYKDLSESAYHGEINFQDYYLVFRPETYAENVGSKYECAIFRDYGDYCANDSYFDVLIKGNDLIFTYTSGAEDIYLEGIYDGSNLTINGSQMTKVNVESIPHSVFGIGQQAPVTIENTQPDDSIPQTQEDSSEADIVAETDNLPADTYEEE